VEEERKDMKPLKQSVKSILNIDFGATIFILGITLVIALVFKAIGGQSSLVISNGVLLISAITLMFFGIIITVFNRDRSEYEVSPISKNPELKSSLEKSMELAWQDHHHARNQTWEALKIEALLAIALIGIDVSKIVNPAIPYIGSTLLFLLSISGIMITLHHRELERRKFRHIMHCEEALGLRKYIDGVKPPSPIYIWDIFMFWKSNTILFIMRMHFTILIIAVLFFLSTK
jgi:hypothetical protein